MRFGWQIAEGGYYFTAGNYSVATIGRVYCPNTATHPDQADKWIENTLGYMIDFYEAAGIDISEFLGGDAAGVASFAQQFVGEVVQNQEFGCALSLVMMALMVISVLITNKLQKRSGGAK